MDKHSKSGQKILFSEKIKEKQTLFIETYKNLFHFFFGKRITYNKMLLRIHCLSKIGTKKDLFKTKVHLISYIRRNLFFIYLSNPRNTLKLLLSTISTEYKRKIFAINHKKHNTESEHRIKRKRHNPRTKWNKNLFLSLIFYLLSKHNNKRCLKRKDHHW